MSNGVEIDAVSLDTSCFGRMSAKSIENLQDLLDAFEQRLPKRTHLRKMLHSTANHHTLQFVVDDATQEIAAKAEGEHVSESIPPNRCRRGRPLISSQCTSVRAWSLRSGSLVVGKEVWSSHRESSWRRWHLPDTPQGRPIHGAFGAPYRRRLYRCPRDRGTTVS